MRWPHDLGGEPGFGRVDLTPDEPVFAHDWERTSRALVYAVVMQVPNATTSAFRHSIERMDPDHYLQSSYYEHWLTSAATLAVEHGMISREDLEARAGGRVPLSRPAQHPVVPGSGGQRFAVGDRVRVVAEDHGGHSRCPGYVRGRVGEVTAVDGSFSLPDVEAHDTRRVVEAVYTVAFEIEAGATVRVGLWDSYLEAA